MNRLLSFADDTSKLEDQVYSYLVCSILQGDMKPGDRLSEAKIAKEFNISRTPVRSAMQHLASIGILESKPNCNTVVASWSDERILQLEVVRTDLENLAAKCALIYGSNNDFNQMHKYSLACYEAGQKNDIVGQLKEDMLFHMEIARIAKNDLLYKIMKEVHLQVCFLLCWRKDFLVSSEKQYQQHENITKALMDRDEDTLLKLLTHHNRHAFKVDDTDYFTAQFFLKNLINE